MYLYPAPPLIFPYTLPFSLLKSLTIHPFVFNQDLQSATNSAFRMISEYGMSKELGPVEFGQRYEHLSSETRARIETEVQRMLSESYEEVRRVLAARRKELDLLAYALVQYETLDRGEVEKVIRGEKLDRPAIPGGSIMVPIRGGDGLGIGGGGDAEDTPPAATPGGVITAPK